MENQKGTGFIQCVIGIDVNNTLLDSMFSYGIGYLK